MKSDAVTGSTSLRRIPIVNRWMRASKRLHVRYDAAHFPEDLMFQETSDRSNFQARYILRHPWTGTKDCPAATTYQEQLRERYEREAQTLANLTGWNIGEIRKTMNLVSLPGGEDGKWYQRLWVD
ncbi:MAG: hypothetical protein U0223_15090 [Nitrospira sp.]